MRCSWLRDIEQGHGAGDLGSDTSREMQSWGWKGTSDGWCCLPIPAVFTCSKACFLRYKFPELHKHNWVSFYDTSTKWFIKFCFLFWTTKVRVPRIRLHISYSTHMTLTLHYCLHTLIQGPGSRACSDDILNFTREHAPSFSIPGSFVVPLIKWDVSMSWGPLVRCPSLPRIGFGELVHWVKGYPSTRTWAQIPAHM